MKQNSFYITGEINLHLFDNLVVFVRELPCDTHGVDIHINSAGGSVMAAFAIVNLLRQIPCQIRTINLGKVDSAAIILFLCGNVRAAYRYSRFSFHHVGKPLDSGAYTYLQLEKFAKETRDCEMRIVDMLNKTTKFCKAFWREQLCRGSVFTPEQAVKYHLATEISNDEKKEDDDTHET